MSKMVRSGRKRKTTTSPYFNRPPENLSIGPTFTGNDNNPRNLELEGSNCTRGSTRLAFSFFNIPCVELAKALLGKILARKMVDGTVIKGRIVETESYLGGEDKASISYGGKITEKSKPMYMQPGTTFVYLTYGMYNLINISSKGDGAAVLLRALDPLEGLEQMSINRNEFQPNKSKYKKENKKLSSHHLCNGPAKLCISLAITKEKCNMQDLTSWDEMWIEPGEEIPKERIVMSRRIGIDSAGVEWANKLLRFYVIGNKSVSKKDKLQEDLLLNGGS